MREAAEIFGGIFGYLAPGVYLGRRAFANFYRSSAAKAEEYVRVHGHRADEFGRPDKGGCLIGAFFATLFWPITAILFAISHKPPMNAEEKARAQEDKIRKQADRIRDLERELYNAAQ